MPVYVINGWPCVHFSLVWLVAPGNIEFRYLLDTYECLRRTIVPFEINAISHLQAVDCANDSEGPVLHPSTAMIIMAGRIAFCMRCLRLYAISSQRQ